MTLYYPMLFPLRRSIFYKTIETSLAFYISFPAAALVFWKNCLWFPDCLHNPALVGAGPPPGDPVRPEDPNLFPTTFLPTDLFFGEYY